MEGTWYRFSATHLLEFWEKALYLTDRVEKKYLERKAIGNDWVETTPGKWHLTLLCLVTWKGHREKLVDKS